MMAQETMSSDGLRTVGSSPPIHLILADGHARLGPDQGLVEVDDASAVLVIVVLGRLSGPTLQ